MTIELTPSDAGSRRALRVGDIVTVRLPESPTTGYRWEAHYDDASLRPTDDRFDAAGSSRGSGGVRVLTFEAVRAGEVTLHLANRRAWESGAPSQEFSVQLDVRG
jgi:inhibitor of cysteine peptidase